MIHIFSHPYWSLNSVYFTDVNTGYTVGYDLLWNTGINLKTIDGGTTWSELSNGGGNAVFFPNADTGYIAYGGILKTTDGGTTWTNIWGGIPAYFLHSIYFTDVNTGYGAGNWAYVQGGWGAFIIKTIDGGSTWAIVWQGSGLRLNSVYFSDSSTGFAVGDYGNILKTVDAGTTWDTLSVQTNISLNSVFFTNNMIGYVTGSGGTILKTSNGGGPAVGIIEPPRQMNNSQYSLKIYPNPARELITIELPEPVSKMDRTVSIYGMTGQELIRQQVQGSRVVLNISSLPAGIYFIRLAINDRIEFGKFVKE